MVWAFQPKPVFLKFYDGGLSPPSGRDTLLRLNPSH